MTMAAATMPPIAWWKEPTKDQWYAYLAAWAGWTLDAFDFTAFLLIIAPIAKEFDVPVPEVAAVLTITLWMRLLGATASGWLADRIGRKIPAILTFIGLIVVYMIGKSNLRSGIAGFAVFVFSAELLVGSVLGSASRDRHDEVFASVEFQKRKADQEFAIRLYRSALDLPPEAAKPSPPPLGPEKP